jgi:putative PEP-CTERM system TPR-repeat lipoprotein
MFSNTPIHRASCLLVLALIASGCSSPEEQKQQHFERGNQYVAEKRDDFAVIEYANAVRIDPKFGEARLKLAETYERMNNLQAAFPEFIRAADELPENRGLQLKVTELLLLARRYEDAKARAAKVLEKNPRDVEAMVLRATAMAEMKDVNGAVKEIEDALKVDPTASRTYVGLGSIRARGGQKEEAEAAFRQAVTLDPSSVSARLAFANFLWSAGRAAEAEQETRQAVIAEPRHLLANRMLAALYVATNRTAEAEAPLKVVTEVSQAPEAKFELAQYYVNARRDAEATKLLTELAAGQATSGRAESMMAALDYERGRAQEAHTRIDKLITRTPNDTDALVLKTRFLLNENKLDGALESASRAVKANPQSIEAHYLLGRVHSLRRNNAGAIAAFTEVLRLNPRVVGAQIELSRLNALSGDRDAAVRFAEEANQNAPGNFAARAILVRTLLAQRQLDRADNEIQDLLKTAPNASPVHALNGTLQTLRNNQAAARTAYERALELEPRNLEALSGLVVLDLANKQFAAALKRVDAELAKQPEHVELLTLAARVYEQSGQPERAEQALRRAVTKDPRYLTGYASLAQLYIRQRRIDEARQEFEGIVKRDPRAVGARTLVGILLERQGKREEAKRSYEATVAAVPSAPVAANNLAYIYAEEGANLDVALQLASAAKRDLPENPEISDTLGWVYYKRGQWPLAVAQLEDSAKQRPTNPEILYHLGMAYAGMKEKDKARDALERALKLNPQFPGAASARQALLTVSQ